MSVFCKGAIEGRGRCGRRMAFELLAEIFCAPAQLLANATVSDEVNHLLFCCKLDMCGAAVTYLVRRNICSPCGFVAVCFQEIVPNIAELVEEMTCTCLCQSCCPQLAIIVAKLTDGLRAIIEVTMKCGL